MMKTIVLIITTAIFFAGCAGKQGNDAREKAKKEIIAAEKAFEAMVAERGMAEGFAFYAAENAVLNRRDTIVPGRENIRAHYGKSALKEVSLRWAPDFADAAESGELGYTYGRYTFNAKDSLGKEISSKGYFHTVWKKQADGAWKYVWD